MSVKDRSVKVLISIREYSFFFLRWLILGILIGAVGGCVGALFSKLLVYVTSLRQEHNFLLWLLPLGGVITAGIYKLCKLSGADTNAVFANVRDEKKVPWLLAPAVFVAAAITHLLGGSAGREGAALQIGGGLATLISKIIPITEKQRHILTLCGMAALFSALFGTPIGACVFAVEVVCVGRLYTAAFFPCMVSSCTAYGISKLMGTHAESFEVGKIPGFVPDTLWKVMVIAVLGAVIAMLFCEMMHLSHKLFARYIKNTFIRAAAGGVIIILFTLIVGNRDYNGGGIEVLDRIFEGGEVRYEAFLLKIIFTAVTIGAGFKGGEIVPTLFIGGTLGAAAASVIGLATPFGAAVGMAALFASVTNCPIATVFLCAEMFGGEGMVYYMMAGFTAYLLSGRFSLYSGQKMEFSRLNDEHL